MLLEIQGFLLLAASLVSFPATALAQAGPHAPRTTFRTAPPEVWVVDASGAGQFTEIQPAIDAAADGDTVLVRPGSYASFLVDGRSLTITADHGGAVHVDGGCAVRNLSSNARVLLAGLDVMADNVRLNGLAATDCQGSLRVERCTLHGYDSNLDGESGLLAQACSDLVLDACSITGGKAQSDSGAFGDDGGDGVTLTNCTTAVYGTTCTGERASAGYLHGGYGGFGARISGGSTYASDCFFRAGPGGASSDCKFGFGGDAGVPISGSMGAVVQALDCLVEGARGGVHPCGSSGQDSGPLGSPGPYSTMTGAARSLSSSLNPVREGETLALTVTGAPGDTVFLVFSFQGAHAFDADLHGVVLTAQPWFSHPMIGTIPASGSLMYTLPIGAALVPHGSAQRWYVQGVAQTGAGSVFLTNPVDLVVLDGSL